MIVNIIIIIIIFDLVWKIMQNKPDIIYAQLPGRIVLS